MFTQKQTLRRSEIVPEQTTRGFFFFLIGIDNLKCKACMNNISLDTLYKTGGLVMC